MLSGNGRHRRPRQAPALLVAAGVTGSAIAIPLLGASGASAADGSTWDKVAECESGGAWSANSGNGFFGGLQLAQEDWEQYGGLDYAPSADQASRSQQIAVAEKILADQGAGAWPACGLLHGLGEDSRSANVDTGLAGEASAEPSTSPDTSSDSSGLSDSPESSSSSESSTSPSPSSSSPSPSSPSPSDEPSDEPSDAADNSAKSDTSAESSPSASRDSASSSTGSTEGDDTDKSVQSGGSSYLTDTGTGTGKHRGASADEAESEGRADTSGRHASYSVRTGDTLTTIADSLELNGGWRALYAENKGTIGADPDLIIPGQTLGVGVETGENQR
ncbi:transglycosylase family protein [Streptomyces sp. DG2A-72]|uniref:LysM peptidoglycan-binding domain-containing protein n=1 Tax=Streptomyces sp. DG2A-72 TaxID=3051386 RepID=UPI00265C4FC7|nr:transglycosylase family protein [Streptomyces sp. DG2A-72]MDO0933755.1 transglycosylase family protein [Streptomyces sp. DG2A-72]